MGLLPLNPPSSFFLYFFQEYFPSLPRFNRTKKKSQSFLFRMACFPSFSSLFPFYLIFSLSVLFSFLTKQPIFFCSQMTTQLSLLLVSDSLFFSSLIANFGKQVNLLIFVPSRLSVDTILKLKKKRTASPPLLSRRFFSSNPCALLPHRLL